MKSKLLAAALVAATALSLPAFADSGEKMRPHRDDNRYERRDDRRDDRRADRRDDRRDQRRSDRRDENWRHDGRYDRRDYWADNYRYNHQQRRPDWRYYRGPVYSYSPRWNGGRYYRDGYRDGMRDWRYRYSDRGYHNRYDHWDGRRWHRTYCDDDGVLFYYDGDIAIRLRF